MNNALRFCCFGEVLWDLLPDRQLLGGAPLNVALRLHSLGSEVCMISAVGNDHLGRKAIEEISTHGLDRKGIGLIESLPTGTVEVHLADGIASYNIAKNAAWDEIPLSDQILGQVRSSDALVFGTLALRESHNREVLQQLLAAAPYKVIDLNLRAPFFDLGEVNRWMAQCDLVKMNEEELKLIVAYNKLQHNDIRKQLVLVQKLSGAETICLTLGARGAILFSNGVFFDHPGYPVKVVDTIGAGDSFLAGLLHRLFSDDDPNRALERACAIGALVASKNGANCRLSPADIRSFGVGRERS